ncbi:uncharacterized protein EV420DRAFT_1497012 [Desarmillaria tabescens]|uniref:CS domain-containing protein n=1 Tax=Armillaria tabescens TaxID=1929756 RepID=A0AA39NQ99_ARMTA|nr:uncharacterized protein EV420DRAFT_1497012 [Desarmillaria tabescens]KAK0469846.1 hypothetical protein EV420DRAFT_1497012 [Desarmillaria tabescens]
MDKLNDTRYYSYSWHQSHDQATVLLMVPYDTQEEDMSVVIERNYLIAGVRGQAPIIKGRLYGNVDVTNSVWQLEPHSSRLSARERTTSTASMASTHSSYAFVSDPEISSSFAASLESGQASDAEEFSASSPALSSPSLSSADEQRGFSFRRKPHSSTASRAVSPGHIIQSIASSYSSVESLHSQSGRLLTLHLEKDQSIIWPSLIVGPVPDTLAPYVRNSVIFDASYELEHQYNMDPTSLVLLAMEQFDIHKDREEAFECFLRAWHLSHAPTSTMKLVSHYLPLQTEFNIEEYQNQGQAPRGTTTYYIQCIGGPRGLAQLYLEAGMLHLDGAASTLLSSSHSSLSSIRIPARAQMTDTGTMTWKRDREAAGQFFDRARALAPDLDIPTLPPHTVMDAEELEMPSIELQYDPVPNVDSLRRRRKRDEKALLENQSKVDDLDSTWYVYLPGLIGAGTALVVVGVIGALSFSWSRRNQAS